MILLRLKIILIMEMTLLCNAHPTLRLRLVNPDVEVETVGQQEPYNSANTAHKVDDNNMPLKILISITIKILKQLTSSSKHSHLNVDYNYADEIHATVSHTTASRVILDNDDEPNSPLGNPSNPPFNDNSSYRPHNPQNFSCNQLNNIERPPDMANSRSIEGLANSNQPKNSTLLETHESVPVVDPGLDLEIQRHHYEDIDTIYLTIR